MRTHLQQRNSNAANITINKQFNLRWEHNVNFLTGVAVATARDADVGSEF
jgi:hypothetical protein